MIGDQHVGGVKMLVNQGPQHGGVAALHIELPGAGGQFSRVCTCSHCGYRGIEIRIDDVGFC